MRNATALLAEVEALLAREAQEEVNAAQSGLYRVGHSQVIAPIAEALAEVVKYEQHLEEGLSFFEMDRDAVLKEKATAQEKADADLKKAREKNQEAGKMIAALRQRVQALEQVLFFYANPETYFAIGFVGDSPCGEFLEDGSDCDAYAGLPPLGKKPGRRAREALGLETFIKLYNAQE